MRIKTPPVSNAIFYLGPFSPFFLAEKLAFFLRSFSQLVANSLPELWSFGNFGSADRES